MSNVSRFLVDTDYLMNVFLLNNIFKNYLAFAKGLVEDCGGDSRLMDTPLKVPVRYLNMYLICILVLGK